MTAHTFSEGIERDFVKKKIDRTLTLTILDRFNRGDFDGVEPIEAKSIPRVDGEDIIDTTGNIRYRLPAALAEKRLLRYLPKVDLSETGKRNGSDLEFGKNELLRLGMRLVPLTAYGILNGGSASSYIDKKKNISFSEKLYEITKNSFQTAASVSEGKPKGVTPAFLNPDGSPGPSFLELKIRALLLLSYRYHQQFGQAKSDSMRFGMLPIFQMTSQATDKALNTAFKSYVHSPWFSDLISEEHQYILSPLTATQPLLSAYTHSSEGRPKELFTRPWGREDTLLPLPGGHGQNFSVLKNIYRDLVRSGKRFAYLGNIDNLGNTIDPLALALLALSGKEAAFEFSYKTPVDVKGGVLVKDASGRLNAADIGPAVSKEEVQKAEQEGVPILFNCATGLFDLEYLSRNIDRISETLPTRFSDQNKDAGSYSQAEQITWEVMGLMDNPLILAVHKYDRFLASKLLLENLMTSGTGLTHPDYPEDFKPIAEHLHAGLTRLLAGPYGLKLRGDRWVPLKKEEL